MNSRMKRLSSDYEQVKKDFAGHKNIIVTPVGAEPPEKYNVTYFVNGIYLLPDGKVETLGRHEVEIILHAEYPRYKPLCKIHTPIWHPNFRDGQICIGDIWGAGESLTDIIINIGDMIQYKSWNSSSPLSADAAQWAIENKHMFPVGNINLNITDYASAKDSVEIDLFEEDRSDATGNFIEEKDSLTIYRNVGFSNNTKDNDINEKYSNKVDNANHNLFSDINFSEGSNNDFDITAEELEGIEFVPSVQRMQTIAKGEVVKSANINFKTIFMKGILWAFIGGILGFVIQELMDQFINAETLMVMMGYMDGSGNLTDSILSMDTDHAIGIVGNIVRIDSGFFAAFVACSLGLLMGLGEGVYYGSKESALKYAAAGAGISLAIGFVSGYIAQFLYAELLTDYSSDFTAAIIRGFGWSIMGLGVGISIGLIRPEKKRIIFCAIGGTCGGFLGGFIFNFIANNVTTESVSSDVFSRAAGIIIMDILIGLGIALLEQFAKQAWLKVVRGEFEGKEYLVFAGTTSIGNNSKNTIVLFKDKLVGPHHCDITLEGSRYVIADAGTPMGTIVNGNRIVRHVLRNGDTIAVGNSVLVFSTK